MSVVRSDVENAAGALQKCTGSSSGIEATVNGMQEMYVDNDMEGVLMIDGKNAFNSLNRAVAIHNIQRLCPVLARIVLNCYRIPARLLVIDDGDLLLSEGTTQRDPLSMAVYALATVPLTNRLTKEVPLCRQSWYMYADDSGVTGNICGFRTWFDVLSEDGQDMNI